MKESPFREAYPMPATTPRLARFRADPKKVRVAIRRQGDGVYFASIQQRCKGPLAPQTYGRDANPIIAVTLALEEAHSWQMDGVDVGCDWAYDHPWPKPEEEGLDS
jgi:hypothetical protein